MTVPSALLLIALVAVSLALVSARRRSAELTRRLERASADLEHLQRTFARFAPPSVVDDLVVGARPSPEKREVTVLFADIQGFTALSERLDAAVLVRILNGYLRVMTAAIAAHRGHVAKFMGDGIMALFGAPEPNPWQAPDGVRAALAMRAALAEYNVTLRDEGLPELAFGVGLHRGVAVAGLIGGDTLQEFTVIGDAVNVAARVESATRGHGVDILVTDAVREKLDDRFRLRALPPTTLKGKSEPVALWAVEG